MRTQVLALDFDGTIAHEGRLDDEVRKAIEEARDRGISVLLVTGRILADLERLLADPSLFDAIVAENGAVLHFPANGRSLTLAAPPDPTFLAELGHREVPFLAGQCVVDTDARHAVTILEVVRDTQLPLVLLFNRGRLMVLPQAVSKATGLRAALRALRLSQHNTIGIGDAENDHQLLSFCELGAAVAWGSQVLQAAADEVIPGDGPRAVADYIRSVTRAPRIEAERLGRRRIHLGVRADGEPFDLAVRSRNILIAGDSQTGKSWLAGALCEQLVLDHYTICVLDPEGEYGTLQTLPSVVIFDGRSCPPSIADVERTLRYPDLSAVFDLSSMSLDEKRVYVHRLLEQLIELRDSTGLPHRIVLDEAHYFLHDEDLPSRLDLAFGGYTLVTWHATQLHQSVLDASEVILATRVTDRDEAEALHALRGEGHAFGPWFDQLRHLERDQGALLPGATESGQELVQFRVSARLTPHTRHRQKYLNIRAARGHQFVFHAPGVDGWEAHTLGELVGVLSKAPDLAGHLERHDLSRWVRRVFGDPSLANHLRDLEETWQQGRLDRPHLALIDAIRSRYGPPPPPHAGKGSGPWESPRDAAAS